MGISPRAMLEEAARFKGWGYGAPAYPRPLPGVKVPLAPPTHTNCCAFVEAVVVGSMPDIPWSLALHNRAMILSPQSHRMGPVEAFVEAGIAYPVPTETRPPPWSVCQGWRWPGRDDGGHTFLIADIGAGDDVLILEANKAYTLNGVGWRSIGEIEGPFIPPDWKTHKRVWTWRRVVQEYPELAVCALRVVDELPDAVPVLVEKEPEGGGSVRA